MFSTAWNVLVAARNTLLPPPYHFRLHHASDSATQALADVIRAGCPSLQSSNARPPRMLPNGYFQTAYAGLADLSSVDHVEYVRRVIITPDGGTLSLDICAHTLTSAAVSRRSSRAS